MRLLFLPFIFLLIFSSANAQNSLVGDGFGGRLWYKSYNYTVGSYSAYTVCGTTKQLYGWGEDGYSQIGNPAVASYTEIPIEVLNMDQVKFYSTGYVMSAIKGDNSGWVWGLNNPTAVKVIDDVFVVDAGIGSCAFVKNDGTVWSVGQSWFGEFGNGTTVNAFSNTPIQMLGIKNAVRTAQGGQTTCVLLEDGTVYCAGKGPALGNGGISTVELIPTKVEGLKYVVDIKANNQANIALDKNGNVWSWGRGIMGLNGLFNSNIPVRIPKLKNIVAISGCNDGFHFLALDENKNCYGWGKNIHGLLGTGNTIEQQEPILISTNVLEIMAGEDFSYIIKEDGTLWAAGGGYIWLGLPSGVRDTFHKIDLSSSEIKLCPPVAHGGFSSADIDSSHIPSEAVIIFPNSFTPNGDGNNDIFRAIIRDGGILEKYRLEVYNRWGQRVFYTEDVYNGWNGRIGGEAQSTSTFYYQAMFATPNRKPLKVKGDVTLIR